MSSSVFWYSVNKQSALALFQALCSMTCLPYTLPFQVFSSNESSEKDPPEPFPQLSKAEGGLQVHKGSWPALKSHQSVVALNSAALVASRTRAFQEQEEAGRSSTPRVRKVVRQASVDGSGEEGEA